MPDLENVKRPEGQRAEYRFFRDRESGDRFKAAIETDIASNGDPVLKIAVSQVDAEGKALRVVGEPDVYWHSHTFTAVERADPDFSVDQRRATMLVEAVAQHQLRRGLRTKLEDMGGSWGDESDDIPLALPTTATTEGA